MAATYEYEVKLKESEREWFHQVIVEAIDARLGDAADEILADYCPERLVEECKEKLLQAVCKDVADQLMEDIENNIDTLADVTIEEPDEDEDEADED